MQVFHRQDFQYLYDNCFSEHDRGSDGFARLLHITDEGVFHDAGLPVELLRWKPVHELAGPNKPPSSGPALPFPFTASQLAAFMLWGWGNYFQDAFGRLDCGPKEFVLNGEHEDAADAYEALRQAYVIYRDALHVVDELNHEEQQRAHELSGQLADTYHQALEREKVMERLMNRINKDGIPQKGDLIPRNEYLPRLARAKEAVSAQKVQALQAKAEADAALKTWRRAMVRQLLQPEATTPSPAPVVAKSASAGTVPIWTTERKEAARAMMNKLRGQGLKAFATTTAAAFGVSPTRLREVLGDKSKKVPAKKAASPWG